MSAGAHDNGEQILFRVHGAISHPVSAEHRRPPGHGGHRCGADVYAEQRAASLEMALEPLLRGVDVGLGSGFSWVPDVDDDQVGLTRFRKCLLDGVADRDLMTEPGDDLGQAL
jgi:hypothetical protein